MAREIQIYDETPKHVPWSDLRKIIIEAREAQERLRPVRDAYLRAKKAKQRMDGPEGFVMVDKSKAKRGKR